jgi:hypothetical protein
MMICNAVLNTLEFRESDAMIRWIWYFWLWNTKKLSHATLFTSILQNCSISRIMLIDFFDELKIKYFSGLKSVPSPIPAAAAFTKEHLSYKTLDRRNSELSGAYYLQLRTAGFKAYCAIWVRCSNFCHQAPPRVSPRESTQRRKVELWARNVR